MKTGQRVVCIKSATFQPVVKGKIYTINAVLSCDGCGRMMINCGFPKAHNHTYNVRCDCGAKTYNSGLAFTAVEFFIPLDENWTEEVITNVLKKQLTEPVNNGLHFSQIIG